MIGDCDPNEAKKLHPESLRAKFGTSLIRNEFHGSDSPFDANKERDIFKFPIP
jgi:nucleoside diphosphate kinase